MSKDTREILLDKAEELFAERGVAGTSIRELSRAAGVNVAAVNYHFGSKEGLVRAVLQRRLRPINQKRLEALKRLLAQTESLNVAEVVRAFAAPAFEALRQDSSSATNFLSFLGRAMMEPDPQVREIFLKEMEPVLVLLWQALKAALPELGEERLFWRMQFLLGAMVRALSWPGRKYAYQALLKQPPSQVDPLEEFVAFVTAGLEAAYEA